MSAPSDVRRFMLTALFAIWALAYAYSFAAYGLTEPSGDGFTRGMNRVSLFLGWQGIAGVLAVAIFGVSRNWPDATSVRRLGSVPLALAGLKIAVLTGFFVWAMFQG